MQKQTHQAIQDRPLTIGLLLDPTADREREIARGVLNYVLLHPRCTVFKRRAIPFLLWDEVGRWRGDGLIAQADTRAKARRLVRKGLPTVNVSSDIAPDLLPTVHSDERAIGQALADHLLGLGLPRYAFAGHPRMFNDQARYEGFRAAIEAQGDSCLLIRLAFRPSTGGDVPLEIDRAHLAESLRPLTLPVGIGVSHDDFAHEVIASCAAFGLRVPYDVAVVGVNNYRLICETTRPPLSSISQRAEQIGYEAAALLERLIDGQSSPTEPVLVPPGEIVVRRSSDYLAVEDETVTEALELIRTSQSEALSVDHIAHRLAVSRRSLFDRFVRTLGHSPAAEIRLERNRRAKKLLATTEMSIVSVGLASGYESTSSFVRAFRQATATTPLKYRRAARGPWDSR